MKNPNWTPAELDRIRTMIAAGKRAAEIAPKFPGRTVKAVWAAAFLHKLGPWNKERSPRLLGPPDDFKEKWSEMTNAELCEHYRKGVTTIRKWSVSLKLWRRGPKGKPQPRAHDVIAVSRVPKPPIVRFKQQGGHAAATDRYLRDMSKEGQAQETLQRAGWNVHRCDVNGVHTLGGSHWRCGRVVCTSAELIERADRVRERRVA